MTDPEFRTLVRACREAQTRYFKTRSPEALALSKQLERAIDTELRNEGRPGLFPKED